MLAGKRRLAAGWVRFAHSLAASPASGGTGVTPQGRPVALALGSAAPGCAAESGGSAPRCCRAGSGCSAWFRGGSRLRGRPAGAKTRSQRRRGELQAPTSSTSCHTKGLLLAKGRRLPSEAIKHSLSPPCSLRRL